jgi:hypothetical protein
MESDVWLYNGTLYVGHEQGALTTARTFEPLYINPILDVLKRQNPAVCNFLEHFLFLFGQTCQFRWMSQESSDNNTSWCSKTVLKSLTREFAELDLLAKSHTQWCF